MLAKDIMTKDVVVLKPNETIKEATQKFAEHNISGSPVVDKNNKIIGILSESDILAALKTHYKELKMVYPSMTLIGVSFIELSKQKELFEAFKEVGSTPISDVMQKAVHSTASDAPVEAVIKIMNENNVNRIPVVDNKKLKGIITRGDIIKGLHSPDPHS